MNKKTLFVYRKIKNFVFLQKNKKLCFFTENIFLKKTENKI